MRLRQGLSWSLVLLVALVVTACEITVTPTPPPDGFPPSLRATVAAQNISVPTEPVRFGDTVGPGSTVYYRVNVNTALDLLFAEADGSNLRVTIYRPSGSVLAVSESTTYFAGSAGALDAAAEQVVEPGFVAPGRWVADEATDAPGWARPETISPYPVCQGPCAVTPITSSTYYVGVHNSSGGSRTFDLYVANYNARDDHEPNDQEASATLVSGAVAFTTVGAIEWLDDVDWFEYSGIDRYITFDPYNAALGLRLRFPDGTVLDGTPGSRTTQVFGGDVFYVYSVLDRAGLPSTSGYAFQISTTVP